jgi:hypothetical protein
MEQNTSHSDNGFFDKFGGKYVAEVLRRPLDELEIAFTEAMKDYPQVKYELVEQKRRARIKVMIPNTHLGVYLDAWWGSYRESLPRQIESLKLIIEAHSKSTLTNFFVYH